MAEKKINNVHEVLIEIKGDEWKKILDDTFKKVNKHVKIDGFREGKAPRDVFERKYGKTALIPDAVDDAVNLAYTRALNEYKGDIIMQPDVAVEKADNDGVTYKFIFTSKPEVKVKKYKNLGVKKAEVKVSAKDVEDEIKKLQSEYADLSIKDGKIEEGDTAVIDFEGFKDGKAFDGGKGENYSLEIGSHTFIPGFEDALIGLKKGDKKDVNLTFPKDYPEKSLEGKDVVFKVTVNEVKTKIYPELDEDFFLDLGLKDVKNEKDLKDTIKKGMLEQKEYEAENKYIDDLFEAVLKETTVDIPHKLIHEEIDNMMSEYEERLKMQGISLEQFLKYTNSTKEMLESQMHPEAEKRIKLRFALDYIIEKEKFEVTDEEAKKDAEEKAKKRGMKVDEYIENFGGLEMLKYDVKVQKVIDLLKK